MALLQHSTRFGSATSSSSSFGSASSPVPEPIGTSPLLLEPSMCNGGSSASRRRLPATPESKFIAGPGAPLRRASSPRMLPTPPPMSPDFRAPSSQALLERRPSGRVLPRTPAEACLSATSSSPSPSLGMPSCSRFSTPDPITPPFTNEVFYQIPDVTIEASSRANSRANSTRSRIVPLLVESVDNEDEEAEEEIVEEEAEEEYEEPQDFEVDDGDTGCDEPEFTFPRDVRQPVIARVVETPDEGVQSQCSSASPSCDKIEQLASKSNSESGSVTGGDALAHGLDPSLYGPNAPGNEPILIRRASAVTPGTVPSSSSFISTDNNMETPPAGMGLLTCTVQHFPVRKRLRVNILKIDELAGQLKPELEIHAQCRISLPGLKSGKEQTSEVKRGRSPVFNQEFFFDNVTQDELESKSIHIGAYHIGGATKLAKDVLIAEFKELFQRKKEIKVLEELKPLLSHKKLGKIHITTCIEKDARRLTINVKKADDLPRWGFLGAPDVCVKITLDQGGIAKTKCTRVLKSTTTAVYNEAVSFQSLLHYSKVMFLFNPIKSELAQTKITISVHDMQRSCTGDDTIGVAYLGILAQDKSESEQWKNTIEHMGKEYKQPVSSGPSVHVAHNSDDDN